MRLALALAAAIGLTQQTEPIPSETAVVHVRAVVSDKSGRAVDDLRADEFEVLEDDSPRVLESVRFVTAAAADGAAAAQALPEIESSDDERAEAARQGARLFAFFLDEYHVTRDATVRVRETLNTFVDDHLGPRDLVVVLRPLDSLLNIRLTRDRQSIADAIAGFEGRKGEYEPRRPFEENFFAGSPAQIEAGRAQIVTSALNALATHLGSLGDTRKAIILVSEGFVRGSHGRGSEGLPTLDGVARIAQRVGVSIYPIDPRAFSDQGTAGQPGAQEESLARDREMLQLLASETGGNAILASPELNGGLKSILSDLSGYYVLAFRSPVSGGSATYRPVNVRVARPGMQVSAKTGYWSLPIGAFSRAGAPSPVVRPAPFGPRRTSPLINPWFGIARGADGRSRVRFVWEATPRVPGDRARKLEPAQLNLKVSTIDGTPVFEGMVQRAGSSSDGAASGMSQAVFEAPPGRLRVLMEIEDETSRVVDTDVRDVIVGGLNNPVAIATAEVLRARTAREFRVLESDPGALPVASRVFSRTERLLVRVRAYAGDEVPELSARLASELGGAMRVVTVEAGPEPGVHQVDVPLAGLAPGQYRIEITATGNRSEAKETVAFRVTP